ncbi:MAG: hypothetical protein ACK5XN_12410, partial [Bacteroidota bacterium]
MSKIFDILKLYRSENIGPVSFFYLINKYQKFEKIFENLLNLEDRWKKKITFASDDLIHKEIEETQKFGADFLTYCDKNFPISLIKNNVTPILITLGNIDFLI